MSVIFTAEPRRFDLLPYASLQYVQCDCCGEDNGFVIALGWIFFGVIFHFDSWCGH